jgi:hypothetical protein
MAEENKSNDTAQETASEADKAPAAAKKANKAAKAGGAKAAKSDEEKPAAKAKEKAPKLEDKPFDEFMEQHYLPSLKAAMSKEGIDDLSLEFAKRKLEVVGQADATPYWQVQGQWETPAEGQRRFNIAFIDEDISGQKVLTLATNGAVPSTIEQFMGDERKITLDLMLLYTLQRLNGQKWLTRN